MSLKEPSALERRLFFHVLGNCLFVKNNKKMGKLLFEFVNLLKNKKKRKNT